MKNTLTIKKKRTPTYHESLIYSFPSHIYKVTDEICEECKLKMKSFMATSKNLKKLKKHDHDPNIYTLLYMCDNFHAFLATSINICDCGWEPKI